MFACVRPFLSCERAVVRQFWIRWAERPHWALLSLNPIRQYRSQQLDLETSMPLQWPPMRSNGPKMVQEAHLPQTSTCVAEPVNPGPSFTYIHIRQPKNYTNIDIETSNRREQEKSYITAVASTLHNPEPEMRDYGMRTINSHLLPQPTGQQYSIDGDTFVAGEPDTLFDAGLHSTGAVPTKEQWTNENSHEQVSPIVGR